MIRINDALGHLSPENSLMKVNILCCNVIWELARLIPNALTFVCVFISNAGSQAYEKLCSVLNNINLVKGIKQASPFAQTSCLEGFHSVLNHFAPKMIAFSYVGMYCRYNNAFFSKSIPNFGFLEYLWLEVHTETLLRLLFLSV